MQASVGRATVPLAGPAGGDGKGKGFASALPAADYEGDWELPARFARQRYSPDLAEIDAVLVSPSLGGGRRELIQRRIGRAEERRRHRS